MYTFVYEIERSLSSHIQAHSYPWQICKRVMLYTEAITQTGNDISCGHIEKNIWFFFQRLKYIRGYITTSVFFRRKYFHFEIFSQKESYYLATFHFRIDSSQYVFKYSHLPCKSQIAFNHFMSGFFLMKNEKWTFGVRVCDVKNIFCRISELHLF